MVRFPDWPRRLETYLFDVARLEFQYGVHDCCLFVCGAVQAMTGRDPAEDFRGRYRTRVEARGLLRAAGGFDQLAARYGLTAIASPAAAGRGSVLQMAKSVLGLRGLNGLDVIVLAEGGLTVAPPAAALKAWRV